MKAYHYLILGETIKTGDEYYNASRGIWETVRTGGMAVYPLDLGNYRRAVLAKAKQS